MKSIITSIILLVVAISSFAQDLSADLIGDTTLSFQSSNYPDKYIRHQSSRVKLTDITSTLDRNDASFVVVPSLSGQAGHVSFESVNFPGHYLRHSGFVMYLHKNDNSDLFKKDASFKPIKGLIGDGYSFQSENFPDRFLRHSGFVLRIDPNNGTDIFKKDASFFMVTALNAPLLPTPTLKRRVVIENPDDLYMLFDCTVH
ncbi:MAG: AbfB domain-containing protein [Lewinellaceae bacterium]|nr:AbfB domain-containing protein [Lewinellaceae bacterium]